MSDPKIERVWSAQELLSWARYCREGEHDSEDGFIVQYLAKCTRVTAAWEAWDGLYEYELSNALWDAIETKDET